ncbi:hypothetical protein N7481_002517 [Penicillium waksmanii]|uniref:uncharacterized protein n=1 Tax=Penicillium waksmanii TaxID=69791 RepID=UPI002547A4E3|nr:uncharacterized protein N7481_002517 [Penicillium waksmanii]KAJ5995540.1 hypothetical protein N7481_002517 [Penicillium waksmanii]
MAVDTTSLKEDASTSTTRERDDTFKADFHPTRITAQTFQRLLTCYNTTAQQVQRRKAMLKLQPKGGSKKRKTGSGSGSDAALITKTEFDSSEERIIEGEAEKYLELDRWRYERMPALVWQRLDTGGLEDAEEDEVACFTHEELCRVMEWKTKHGRPRPALLGMIRSNQEKLVFKCTSTALKSLPTVKDKDNSNPTTITEEVFPKQSMDDLSPLRGVGPATASLILSIATTNAKDEESERVQVPFFSDDTYLWLCVEVYPESSASPETVRAIRNGGSGTGSGKGPGSKFIKPNGELNLKYNIAEYRQLWQACFELRERLSGAGAMISMADIEKVAYVLRNIALSGYYPDIDAQEILHMSAEQVDALLARLGECEGGDGDDSPEQKNESETQDEKGPRSSKKTRNA